MNENLTPQELANRWGITRVWLYTLKARGETPEAHKLGLGKKPRVIFYLEEVIKFEEKHFGKRRA